MEIVWISIGIIFLLAGLVGSLLPIIPGPPLAYISLLFLQVTDSPPFSSLFMILWAVGIVAVSALDYIIPPYMTKKFGGSRSGVIGSSIGIIAGIFLSPPLGIILFPFLGALIGEFMTGKDQKSALRSATGAFLGFVSGTMLKLAVTATIGYFFFVNI